MASPRWGALRRPTPGDALSLLSVRPLDLADRIEAGLPVGALQRVSRLLAPGDARFKYRLVSKATFQRRKAAQVLSPKEGARLARLAGIWSFVVDVWQDEEQARNFLFRSHSMLNDERPIDVVIRSDIGAQLVWSVLAGLKYGSVA